MILIFDLDDTLYEELDFVRSGFRKVADYLANARGISEDEIYTRLCFYLQKGRESIFDQVLKEYNIFSKILVRKCLTIYRTHQPDISLYPDSRRCLERFPDVPKYIVTDGNKLVQKNKINALGLDKFIKFSYITHRYGIKHSKPSGYVFQKICKREDTEPGMMLYIGDNPMKDFVGIKSLGIKTVRIIRGNYKEIRLDDSFEAERNIHSFDEITTDLLNSLLYERNDH
jgi:putative hydrolase of the HAD superfamily